MTFGGMSYLENLPGPPRSAFELRAYPFVWRAVKDGRYAAKAVYTVLGLNQGRKEILGLYLSKKLLARTTMKTS